MHLALIGVLRLLESAYVKSDPGVIHSRFAAYGVASSSSRLETPSNAPIQRGEAVRAGIYAGSLLDVRQACRRPFMAVSRPQAVIGPTFTSGCSGGSRCPARAKDR
jgi:hypothetical protein